MPRLPLVDETELYGVARQDPLGGSEEVLRLRAVGDVRILRDQLWWSIREWLRIDTGAMLPPDEYLVEELACPTYEVFNGKIMVMKKPDMREILSRSPDRAEALMMTFADTDNAFAQSDLERCAA